PILKTRGHYLALVTIAFVFIFNILVNNLEFTGGPQGIKNIPTLSLGGYAFTTRPALAGVELPAHANFYYAALVMAGLTTWVLRRLHDSWLGLVLNTLRDDEIAARCCGVSVTRGKLLAFSIGNFLIGLGVDVVVAEGEPVGVIGPNGSGKTTLFNALTGLLAPAAGDVVFLGRRLTGLEAHAIARLGIARTFQASRLCLDLSAFDNILIGM